MIMGHGRPNALFSKSEHFLKWFIEEAEPAEIKGFYDLLRTGSEKEIRRKVDLVMEDYGPFAKRG